MQCSMWVFGVMGVVHHVFLLSSGGVPSTIPSIKFLCVAYAMLRVCVDYKSSCYSKNNNISIVWKPKDSTKLVGKNACIVLSKLLVS